MAMRVYSNGIATIDKLLTEINTNANKHTNFSASVAIKASMRSGLKVLAVETV